MSLNYNLSKCSKSACWEEDGKMTPLCHRLIWLCLAVDLNGVNEKNAAEFVYRANFTIRMSNGFGRMLTDEVLEELLSVEQLTPFFGMTTNVTEQKRRSVFFKRCLAGMERDHTWFEFERRRAAELGESGNTKPMSKGVV